jgi:hypothetical protein
MMSDRLFQTMRDIMENEFFRSMDLTMESDVNENELYTDYLHADSSFDDEEADSERKSAVDYTLPPVETMKKAVEAHINAKKNKLQAARKHCRKVTGKHVIKRWQKYLQEGGTMKQKITRIKQHVCLNLFTIASPSKRRSTTGI